MSNVHSLSVKNKSGVNSLYLNRKTSHHGVTRDVVTMFTSNELPILKDKPVAALIDSEE